MHVKRRTQQPSQLPAVRVPQLRLQLTHRAALVQGSIITGVLFVTFISWIPGHGASYLGAGSNFPGQQQISESWYLTSASLNPSCFTGLDPGPQ